MNLYDLLKKPYKLSSGRNLYQVTVMSQSENVLAEESSNLFFSSQEKIPFHQDEQLSEDSKEDQRISEPSFHEEGKRKGGKEGFTAQFEGFKKAFESQTEAEARLQLAIDFMEVSLAQGDTPHFQSFWEARSLCLPLFKENLSPLFRHQMWTKYSELSKEARRLKEVLDEQSAFAVEQIEMAIQALEKEIGDLQSQAQKFSFSSQEEFPKSLKDHYSFYKDLQTQLSVLNLQASRINALRKELLKTEMRIRHKNKFFQRLSVAGDLVFPKRKELIRQISQKFTEDVDAFIQSHFGQHASHSALFVLREEIKALQSLAKLLTLNTHAFTHTRMRLSECWDEIKVEERERKKERAQQRVLFKENLDALQKQFHDLKEQLEKKETSLAEGQKKLENTLNQMRKVELGREELKVLREAANEIRGFIQTKHKEEETARHEHERERERQKKEKYHLLKGQIEELLQQAETKEEEEILEARNLLVAQIQEAALVKNEKQELERLMKPLRDILAEKKEKALLSLSDDDRQTLQQLKEVLAQRKERRQEVKSQLEVLRKASGSSSLDFEKAMSYMAQINEERERLEKVDQGIQEIENKIASLQSKLKIKPS